MKKYVPFYESTKLQEKWIKQFQQLNKYDQATLRRVLEKYSVDIENTNFKVFDPLDFDSRAPEWKNPNTKIIFLYQTKDYRTNQPGELRLFCMYHNGKVVNEFKMSIHGGETFYNYRGQEVQPSNANKTVTVYNRYTGPTQRQAPSIDLKYLSRKEIIRLAKYAVVLYEVQVKTTTGIQQQRQAAKSGMITREPVHFNPSDNKYYVSPKFTQWDSLDRYSRDKSGFTSRKRELENKLAQYRKEKLLSLGDEKIINDSISIYQKLLDKISLAPGVKKVPATMSDIMYKIRNYTEVLSSYFSTIENLKNSTSQHQYYADKAKKLLIDIRSYTMDMQKLYALS